MSLSAHNIFLRLDRFRWVSCQFEALRRCFAPSVLRVLEELPETLDETYERILRGIPRANRAHTYRLLQCLTVAVRPLRLQELAEVLAVDFNAAGGIPKLNEDWRWADQEQAVLTACSSLITVINFRSSQMVQFSHLSVKEFLTSGRLATTNIDILRYHHVRLEPAHTIMAQACIGVLLRLEYPMNKVWVKMFPLADYAAKHFTDHAEFGNVMLQITDVIDNLLDQDKPHFAAWMSLISSSWWADKDSGRLEASPLYHVADLGFSGLVQYLISKRPQDVTAKGGVHGTPVHAALHWRNVQVCQLLLPHCISVDVRDSNGQTPLHVAACNALPEIAQMIIEQGTDVNAQDNNGWTPLHQTVDTYPVSNDRKLDIMRLLLDHGADREARNSDHDTPLRLAVCNGQLAAAKLLVEHGASIHARNKNSWTWTPLHAASCWGYLDIMQLLLEHGADREAVNNNGSTAMHAAACVEQHAAVQLLIENGAILDAENNFGRTPLHDASSYGCLNVTRLLLERGANIEARANCHSTPLHLAATDGQLMVLEILIEHGAIVHVRNEGGWTPLHEASSRGYSDIVLLLLEHKADVDVRNSEYATPLHSAAFGGRLEATQLLLAHGANVHAQNKAHQTPVQLASMSGHEEVVRLLSQHVLGGEKM